MIVIETPSGVGIPGLLYLLELGCCREGLARKQEKAMRKFARPAPVRGGLSAAYLEADMDEEDDYADDLGMTPTERARQSLTRPRRVDEAAEVRFACLSSVTLRKC